MSTHKHGDILVGHGGIPKGCPQELITKLKRLEAQRRAAKLPPTAEELELDTKIRQWPRTAETDPYQAGLETVAACLQAQLNGALFAVAYNEFCAPTLEESRRVIDQSGSDSHYRDDNDVHARWITFRSRDSRNPRSVTATVSRGRTAVRLAIRS